MNRSIQSEGAFAEIKQDMGFRRFLIFYTLFQNIEFEKIILSPKLFF